VNRGKERFRKQQKLRQKKEKQGVGKHWARKLISGGWCSEIWELIVGGVLKSRK
jgi:hypothetical protein